MEESGSPLVSKKFKYRGLKVYSSTEWLADGQKKYKRVFESSEVSYLYVELSFFNKFFDVENWKINIVLKCFKLINGEKEQLCELPLDREVASTDNVVKIREGWGHEEPGHYWKRGDYLWEAYVKDEFVGKTYFYVEDGGPVTTGLNPYFDLINIKLFEGGDAGVEEGKRNYLKQFNTKTTRYVWVEFVIENLQDRPWFCELTFNFYNEARLLKGCTTELRQIKNTESEVTLITGWGSDMKGSWYYGRYTLEIVYMDQLLAVVPFECADEHMEGNCQVLVGEDTFLKLEEEVDAVEVTGELLKDNLKQLNTLIGLHEIKKQIHDYVKYLEFVKLRKEQGFEESDPINLHSVFLGNPGTGKTTVARLLGKIYHQMGLLSNGKLHEVGRAELIGQYIGQTAPKVKDILDAARGGVLFIDEAYSLVRNEEDNKDYGHEVIEILVKEMSDGAGDIAIFAAGYPKEMEVFLKSNPGLKSRFKKYFNFPDYLPQELMEIADLMAKEKEVSFTKGARDLLKKKLTDRFRARDYSFGNARLVGSIIDEAKMEMGLRVMKEVETCEPNKQKLKNIKLEDLKTVFKSHEKALPEIDVDDELLTLSLEKLNKLIGLTSIKNNIHELIRLVKFYRESDRGILGKFPLHTVFKGNPGTGKTTVARILAQIYKALGILERGHLVECSRQDLVAGFIGQTALKAQALVDKAKGGVLFVDEAYALFSGTNSGDYGKEAMEVILKEMEDSRGEFIVIMAGYTEEMETLLKMNPGLKSRFEKEMLFEDFSEDELYAIAEVMLKDERLKADKKASTHLRKHFKLLHSKRDKFFGNGREVRKLIDQSIKMQHLRMAELPPEKRTKKALQTLTYADVKQINEESLFGKQQQAIGFGLS